MVLVSFFIAHVAYVDTCMVADLTHNFTSLQHIGIFFRDRRFRCLPKIIAYTWRQGKL